MTIDTGDDEECEIGNELEEGDVEKDDHELGSDEEEEDGAEDKEEERENDEEDDDEDHERIPEFDNASNKGIGGLEQKDKGPSCDDVEDEGDEEKMKGGNSNKKRLAG